MDINNYRLLLISNGESYEDFDYNYFIMVPKDINLEEVYKRFLNIKNIEPLVYAVHYFSEFGSPYDYITYTNNIPENHTIREKGYIFSELVLIENKLTSQFVQYLISNYKAITFEPIYLRKDWSKIK